MANQLNTSIPFSISLGGTGSASQNIGGICYIDAAPAILSNSNFTYNGSNAVVLTSSSTAGQFSIVNTLSGATNNANILLQRADQANGVAQLRLATSSTQIWRVGLKTGDNSFHFNDDVSGLDRFVITQSGNVNIPGLTVSLPVFTDSSKNLTSVSAIPQNVGGTNNTSGYGANQLIFQNSGNTAFTSSTNFTFGTNQLNIFATVAATTATIIADNTDNTDDTSRAVLRARTGGASGGDPYLRFTVAGATDWSTGIDNTDSDSYIISNASTLGASNRLKITTAGVVQIPNLTASLPVFTDASSNLTSTGIVPQANGGTGVDASGYAASQLIFQNSGNTGFTSSSAYTVGANALLTIASASSGVNSVLQLTQSAAGGAGNARFIAQVESGATGDPYTRYVVNGVTNWAVGLDNSDSDAFVVSASTTPGTTNVLRIDTSGSINLSGGTVSVTAGNLVVSSSASGSTLLSQIANTSNTASSQAFMQAQVAGGTAGDAASIYTVSGSTDWHVGLDNSDSDAFSIGNSFAVGSNQALKITTTGVVSIPANDLQVTRSSTGTVISAVNNSNNANSTANARFSAQVGGSSGGDAFTTYTVSGITDWVVGLDNSVSDQFVIGSTDTPGSADRLRITTAGDASVVSGSLSLLTAGKTLSLATGSNACRGSVTLSGASTTVNTTAAVTGRFIQVSNTSVGGTAGFYTISINTGVSFTITSSTGGSDTSTVQWIIFT